jgi:hypothetical protein
MSSAIMLIAIMLSALYAKCHYAKGHMPSAHYAKCHYAKCHLLSDVSLRHLPHKVVLLSLTLRHNKLECLSLAKFFLLV